MQPNTTATPLENFRSRFNEIQKIKNAHVKSIKLAGLKTAMEVTYQIPRIDHLRINAFIRAYPGVMELYKKVSYARPL